MVRRGDPTRVGIRLDGNGLGAEGAQDMSVAGIARRGQRHARAVIENCQEGQHETAAGTGRNHDLSRIDALAVMGPVVAGDAFAQQRQTERFCITEFVRVQGALGRFQHRARCRGPGLSDLHMDDVRAFRLAFVRGPHHVHDDERVDMASACRRLRQ